MQVNPLQRSFGDNLSFYQFSIESKKSVHVIAYKVSGMAEMIAVRLKIGFGPDFGLFEATGSDSDFLMTL